MSFSSGKKKMWPRNLENVVYRKGLGFLKMHSRTQRSREGNQGQNKIMTGKMNFLLEAFFDKIVG